MKSPLNLASWLPGALRSFFLHRRFALLWTGQTVSTFGSHISGMGLPIIAVLLLHATPAQLGLLAALGTLPGAGLGLLIGAWVDRLPCRPLLLVADIGRALLLALIPLLAVSGLLHMAWLAVVAALCGVLTVGFKVACLSFLPTQLAPGELLVGNSRLATSSALAEVAGPPLAALLIGSLTAPVAIVLDACSFLFSALCLGLMRLPGRQRQRQRKPSRPPAGHASVVLQIGEGLVCVYRDPQLRALAAYTCTQSFCGGSIAALYLPYTLQLCGTSGYGLLVACGGLGAFVGSCCAARCLRHRGPGRALIGAALLSGALALCTPLAAGPAPVVFVLLALSQLLGDIGFAVYAIGDVSLRQQRAPAHLLGRVNACMHVLSAGALSLGALLAGLLSEVLGVRLTLLLGAAGLLGAVAWLLCSPLRHPAGPACEKRMQKY